MAYECIVFGEKTQKVKGVVYRFGIDKRAGRGDYFVLRNKDGKLIQIFIKSAIREYDIRPGDKIEIKFNGWKVVNGKRRKNITVKFFNK